MKKTGSFSHIAGVLLISAILALLLSCSSAPKTRKIAETPSEPIVWVELGPDASVSARAITTEPKCPRIRIDAAYYELDMALRAAPSAAFPVSVCEFALPPGTQSARIGNQELPMPAAHPRKILFIGDTGCRIQTHDGKNVAQWSNDPKGWPFPKLAQYEAEVEPDLVIHLGDYLYREDPCPTGNAYCVGSPSGQNWDTWNADFFEAAKPLLRKAPWVFVRGNHELCKRAGEGWFRFLDAGAMRACTDDTDPFVIKQDRVQLVVLDSALATDLKAPEDQVRIYRRQFEKISAMKLEHAWLLTHRPMWAPAVADLSNPLAPVVSFNQTLQTASQNHLPSGINEVFSGHLHLFQEFHFADGRPSQIVIGNGGTTLTPSTIKDPKGIEIGGTKVDSGSTMDDFGYFTLEITRRDAWEGTVHDNDGRPRLFCSGLERGFHCTPSPN